jgi:hypothetical protein
MLYVSVIVILKSGRYHSFFWKDLGSSEEMIRLGIMKKFKNFFSYKISSNVEEVKTWTNNHISCNESIDAEIKMLAEKHKAENDAAHAANLAKKKPKLNKTIKVQSYGQWMAQKHIKTVKKGGKKPTVKTK